MATRADEHSMRRISPGSDHPPIFAGARPGLARRLVPSVPRQLHEHLPGHHTTNFESSTTGGSARCSPYPRLTKPHRLVQVLGALAVAAYPLSGSRDQPGRMRTTSQLTKTSSASPMQRSNPDPPPRMSRPL